MLTDEEHFAMMGEKSTNTTVLDVLEYGRKVEHAARAPLLERIEDLQLAVRYESDLCQQALDALPRQPPQPQLTVRLTSFPESNGKRNWTAMFVRTEPWGGLIGNCGGITIDRGECWNRVAYEAERAKFLIGERDTEPHILDYSDDIATPEEWAGEVRGGRVHSRLSK